MNILLLADLHLTDDKRDEYRWGLFPWVEKQVVMLKVKNIIILGDMTERKDRHPSRLVNRIVENLCRLAKKCPLIILKGNHDYIEDKAFFDFLTQIPDITFISKPLFSDGMLFIPHTTTFEEDWSLNKTEDSKYVFIHQPLENVKVSEAYNLQKGVAIKLFEGCKADIFSGDIHIPQIVGNVEYVGAPYPIHFGDDYKGRAILLSKDGQRSINYVTIQKKIVELKEPEELQEQDLRKGDQLKVRILLSERDKHLWVEKRDAVRDWCKKEGIDLCSVESKVQKTLVRRRANAGIEKGKSDVEVLQEYINRERLGEEYLEIASSVIR